ncbi:MAG: RidA family protein [Rickettsiales bacterium]|jgi:enamine deaminase RidA (YjgF/YER057c/UK114 family)|nr:RidA family protein [Rickettsiales bacterium]
MSINTKLQEQEIELQEPSAPVANYVGYNVVGDMVYVSGQICIENGELKYAGKLGSDYSIEDGQSAARICAINILSQLNAACGGDLNKVKQVVMLQIFINSESDFTDQALVANGASDLIADVFGEKGKHARAAISCNSLPRGTAVEVTAIVQLDN